MSTKAMEASSSTISTRRASATSRVLAAVEGQPEQGGGTLVFAGAFGPEPAAVLLCDLAADIQAQPQPRDVGGDCVLGPAKGLEDPLGPVGRQPDALVAHTERQTGV